MVEQIADVSSEWNRYDEGLYYFPFTFRTAYHAVLWQCNIYCIYRIFFSIEIDLLRHKCANVYVFSIVIADLKIIRLSGWFNSDEACLDVEWSWSHAGSFSEPTAKLGRKGPELTRGFCIGVNHKLFDLTYMYVSMQRPVWLKFLNSNSFTICNVASE